MPKSSAEAISEAIKREVDDIEKKLGECRTHRSLFFQAYIILSMRVQDTMIGVTNLAGLHRTYSLLQEVMTVQAARIDKMTATAAPSVGVSRGDQLER